MIHHRGTRTRRGDGSVSVVRSGVFGIGRMPIETGVVWNWGLKVRTELSNKPTCPDISTDPVDTGRVAMHGHERLNPKELTLSPCGRHVAAFCNMCGAHGTLTIRKVMCVRFQTMCSRGPRAEFLCTWRISGVSLVSQLARISGGLT